MHAVDTNVLIRALTGDDPVLGPRAVAFIRDQGPVWISHCVLMEALWVLEAVYEQAKPQLVQALIRILDNRDLVLEDPAVVRLALEHYQGRGSVSFDDCLILARAKGAGHLPLATFDKGLAKAEGAVSL